MTLASDLAQEITGKVLTDEAARTAATTDFGRIVERRPQVVARPASADDVSRVVKFAAKHSLSVATRGGGHSQAGQSLSDQIVLDMTSLNQVREVGEDSATSQGGVTWRTLLEQLAPQRLSPPVL